MSIHHGNIVVNIFVEVNPQHLTEEVNTDMMLHALNPNTGAIKADEFL